MRLDIQYDEIIIETELAVLLRFDMIEVWIPKSMIETHDYFKRTVEVPRWFAKERDIIDYEVI